MVRRKRKYLLDGLLDVAKRLPWWASVIVAVCSYLVFHSLATTEVAAAKTMAEFAPAVQQTILKSIAAILQFFLPILFLAGAVVSGLGQLKRGSLSRPTQRVDSGKLSPERFHAPPGKPAPTFDQHTADTYPMWISDDSDIVPTRPVDASRWSAELLGKLEWKRFELVCAGLFERLGFTAKTATKGADGGIDIHLFKHPAKQAISIVQCKAWNESSKVGVRHIRELHGVMASEKVAEGIFATTATFSKEAKEYARENHIDLLDGRALLKSITSLTDELQASLLTLAIAGDYTTPTCPSCGIKMTKRNTTTAKPFWGCVHFPRCRSIINIAKV
jgi:restriction system protein